MLQIVLYAFFLSYGEAFSVMVSSRGVLRTSIAWNCSTRTVRLSKNPWPCILDVGSILSKFLWWISPCSYIMLFLYPKKNVRPALETKAGPDSHSRNSTRSGTSWRHVSSGCLNHDGSHSNTILAQFHFLFCCRRLPLCLFVPTYIYLSIYPPFSKYIYIYYPFSVLF